MKGKLDDILRMIHIHPAMNEIIRDAFRNARDLLLKQNIDFPNELKFK